jgi:hypothetical protein
LLDRTVAITPKQAMPMKGELEFFPVLWRFLEVVASVTRISA